MATIATLAINLIGNASGLQSALGSAQASIKKTASSLSSVGKVAAGVAVGGLTVLGGSLAATAASGAKMAIDLESQIAGIAAVMGATKDEVAPLKELILDLGMNPNLKVSTIEAAEAIEMLARNGVVMTDVMNGAAEATVLLANATGGSFSVSADIMTDVMAQFKESAGSYMDAVNGIAAVTNNSKFTIDDYGLAIAQSGGVASSVGVEFDDFNTTIAAISPLFASGSDAGTSFKTMLQTLIPKSNAAYDTMKDLGLISLDTERAMTYLSSQGIVPLSNDADALTSQLLDLYLASGQQDGNFAKWIEDSKFLRNNFFELNGDLKDMADISTILQGALGDLSEEQKNNALSTIFGTDAMRAAVALADSGKVVYTDMAVAAKELGVSQEALNSVAEGGITAFEALQIKMGQVDALESAKTRVDATRGALEILSGVVETVKIRIGDAFLPVIRQVAEQLTVFVDKNGDRIVAFFGQIANGLGAVASYIPPVLDGLIGFAEAHPGLFRLVGLLSLATAAVAPLAVAVSAMGVVFGGVTPTIGLMGGAFGALGAAIAALLTPLGAVVVGMAALVYFDVGGIQGKITDLIGSIREAGTAFKTFFASDDFGSFLGELKTSWQETTGAFAGILQGELSLDEFRTQMAEGLAKIPEAFENLFTGVDFQTLIGELNWDDYISGLTWENVITTTLEWSNYIGQLTWDNVIVPTLEWANYIAPIVWSEIVATLADWGAYIASIDWATLLNTTIEWSSYIGAIVWTEIVTALSDWGAYITSLDWTQIITTVIDWATWIPALTWAGFITAIEWSVYIVAFAWETFITVLDWALVTGEGIDWATFISALTDWSTYVPAINWLTYIGSFAWNSFIEKLEWTGSIDKLENWGTYIPTLTWAEFVVMLEDWGTWIKDLVWSSFVTELSAWADFVNPLSWVEFVFALDWATFVPTLKWPSITWPGWASFVPDFSWPTIPEFPGWGNLLDNLNPFGGGGDPGNNALGTQYWRGGQTWVGENGRPELVTLPRGTQITPANRVGAAGGSAVVVQSMTVRSEQDIHRVAYQVEDIRRRRQRR